MSRFCADENSQPEAQPKAAPGNNVTLPQREVRKEQARQLPYNWAPNNAQQSTARNLNVNQGPPNGRARYGGRVSPQGGHQWDMQLKFQMRGLHMEEELYHANPEMVNSHCILLYLACI